MSEKTDYEIAVAEFEEAERIYKEFEAEVLDGSLVADLVRDVPESGMSPEYVKSIWQDHMSHLQALKENRNAKRTAAANALRSAVQLAESQWRGPDGKSTTIQCGPFFVSSVTRRSFEPHTLLSLAKERGFLPQLLALKSIDPKTGKEYALIRPDWEIDYEGIKNWLRDNNLEDILNGAYDEVESTPVVKGPKLIASLGEDKG